MHARAAPSPLLNDSLLLGLAGSLSRRLVQQWLRRRNLLHRDHTLNGCFIAAEDRMASQSHTRPLGAGGVGGSGAARYRLPGAYGLHGSEHCRIAEYVRYHGLFSNIMIFYIIIINNKY